MRHGADNRQGHRRIGNALRQRASALARGSGQLYRIANTNRFTQAVSLVLVLAILVSGLSPLLNVLAPTQRAYAAPRARVAQASAAAPALPATPVDVCQLYPIALHTSSLAGIAVGGSIPNIYTGTNPGNFGWLTWTGDTSEPTLVTSLTPPGDSTNYVNPNDASDHVLVVGDWVDGRPGVANSQGVRNALTQLESQDIVVPVWDQAQAQGSTNQYHVAGFAQVRITGFQLPGANTISARYLGSTDCLGTPPPPPPPPPSPFNGATLTLSPSTAGPNVVGTTQPMQATLSSRTGTPIASVTVQFTVTGPNAASFSGTTDTNGIASFSYVGANVGTDSVQAATTDPNGNPLQSNTASVNWVKPVQTVSTSTIWARVFPPDQNHDGVFSATPNMTPLFTQAFPTIDFNPPSGTIPGNTSGVNEGSRPMVDVTTDLNGNYSGTIVLQGNGYQAGLQTNDKYSLPFFDVVFTGTLTVAAAGQATFNLYTDDGFVLGVGSDAAGDVATRVAGPMVNPPSSGTTNFMHFPVTGSYNQGTPPVGNDVTISFPAAGTYPYELDYSEGVCCTLVVTATTVTASGTQGIPPTGSLVLSPSTVNTQVAGGQQAFTLLATDAGGAPQANLPAQLTIVGANSQTLNATTDSTGHATFTYTGTYAGTDTIQAIAWVGNQAAYSGQVTVQWTTPPTPPPTPQTVTQGWLGAPTNQTQVSGLVPITLASNVTLASGTVSYWPANNPSAAKVLAGDGSSILAPSRLALAEGANSSSRTLGATQRLVPNISGSGGTTLATLDTTTIPDGTYIISLNGTDSSGNKLNSEVLVTVVGENKPGRVVHTETDVTVPVAGLPITVGRTYDSLNRNQVGDFGNGWSLTIGHPQLTVDAAHDVTLTMPNGRRATFAFTPQSTGGLFGFLLTPGYTPEPGVYGSLTSNGCGLLVVSGGQYVCFLDAQYAPTTYRYTDPYGRVYVMGADSTLQSITDLNGNELVFGPTGITSSAGNSVSFARDSQGRITKISDPAGNLYQYSYDGNGNLSTVSLPELSTPISYTYDTSTGILASVTDPRGNAGVTSTYDPNTGRLTSQTDAAGDTTTYSYDLSANTVTEKAPDGGQTILKYDSFGMLVSETDPLNRTTTYAYDANHNLTAETDPLGHQTTYTYDGQGNPTAVSDPLGNTSGAHYNEFGGPDALTDAAHTTWTISYNSVFLPTSIGDSLGTRGSFSWDSHGNLQTATNGANDTVTLAYDAYGNLTSQTDPLQHSASFTYDQLGRKLTSKDANGNITNYTYDALGHLVQTLDAAQGKTINAYDADGNLTSVTDANGHTTNYVYDKLNRQTEIIYPDQTTTRYTYDFRGNVLTETDQAGRVTQNQYDQAGELTSVTTALGTTDQATTTYTYYQDGRLYTETDPMGHTTTYTYDKAGHLLTVTDARGVVTASYTYDADGRQTSVTDGNSHTTSYAYDIRGHLLTTTYPDTTTTQQTYDGAGNVLSSTDQNSHTTNYTYDSDGRLLSVSDALQEKTQYTYDPNGNLLMMTDANQHQTQFSYDALNRQIKKIWPDGSFEQFGYDAVGNHTSHQLADGHINQYTYDNMDRLTLISYFDSSSVHYTYSPTGQQATVVDSRGTTTYSYDNQDRVTGISLPDGQSISYGYDLTGNRTSMGLTVGSVSAGNTAYTYDQDNQLIGLNAPNAGVISFSYDKAGNQTQRALPNGIAVNYGYDSLNRLTGVVEQQGSTTLASYSYTLDGVGNRTKVVNADGTSTMWSYDPVNRLLGEAQLDANGNQTAQTSYKYDAVGNRLSMSSGGQTVNYTYNKLDQLTGTSGAQSSQYSYDGRGNLVSSTSGTSTTSYTYDAADRMTGATLPNGTSVTYGYDAAGRQVSQMTDGTTTNDLWDEQSPYGDIVLETDGSGATQASYTLDGQGTLLAQTRGSGSSATTSYVLPDGQGSVRALANSSGTVTDRYTYDAFGNLTSSTGTTTMPYRFDGQRQDALNGLYQLRARSYDPTTGRFLSRDTAQVDLGGPGQLDRYAYTQDNPINLIDPAGLQALPEQATLRISLAGLVRAFVGFAVWAAQSIGDALLTAVLGLIEFCVGIGIMNCVHAGQGLWHAFAAAAAMVNSVKNLGGGSGSPGGNPPGGNPPGGGGGGGGGGQDLSQLVIQTGKEVARDQKGQSYTAGKLVMESVPDANGQANPDPALPYVSPLLKGSNDPYWGHAEEQAIGWAKRQLGDLLSRGWTGQLVITVITGVSPCNGQHPGHNCQLNFPTWASDLRTKASSGSINVLAVRDLYWSDPSSDTPAGRWDY